MRERERERERDSKSIFRFCLSENGNRHMAHSCNAHAPWMSVLQDVNTPKHKGKEICETKNWEGSLKKGVEKI